MMWKMVEELGDTEVDLNNQTWNDSSETSKSEGDLMKYDLLENHGNRGQVSKLNIIFWLN